MSFYVPASTPLRPLPNYQAIPIGSNLIKFWADKAYLVKDFRLVAQVVVCRIEENNTVILEPTWRAGRDAYRDMTKALVVSDGIENHVIALIKTDAEGGLKIQKNTKAHSLPFISKLHLKGLTWNSKARSIMKSGSAFTKVEIRVGLLKGPKEGLAISFYMTPFKDPRAPKVKKSKK